MQQCRHQTRARRAERVAQCDGAAVDVDLGHVRFDLSLPGQDHRSERLIDLDQVYVLQLKPGLL